MTLQRQKQCTLFLFASNQQHVAFLFASNQWIDKFFGPGFCFIAENPGGGIICSFRGRVIKEI